MLVTKEGGERYRKRETALAVHILVLHGHDSAGMTCNSMEYFM